MKVESLKHAIVSTDVVLFVWENNQLKTVLIDVKNEEYFGRKAFPGGLILPTETFLESVKRIIKIKLSIDPKYVYLEEFGARSDVNRDKRGRIVSIVYLGIINSKNLNFSSEHYAVINCQEVKNLAYDHDSILKDALIKLKERFSHSTIAQNFLNKSFTIGELYNLYCLVLEQERDKRNFMKKIKKLDIIQSRGEKLKGKKNRPAELFGFKGKKVINLSII